MVSIIGLALQLSLRKNILVQVRDKRNKGMDT